MWRGRFFCSCHARAANRQQGRAFFPAHIVAFGAQLDHLPEEGKSTVGAFSNQACTISRFQSVWVQRRHLKDGRVNDRENAHGKFARFAIGALGADFQNGAQRVPLSPHKKTSEIYLSTPGVHLNRKAIKRLKTNTCAHVNTRSAKRGCAANRAARRARNKARLRW